MIIVRKMTNPIEILYNFFRYQKVINKVVCAPEFIQALSSSFGVTFRKDRIGRLYTVINPYVQKIDINGSDIIYDQDKPVIDKWIMDKFILIDMVIKNHDLFDILTYNIERVDDDMNYLLTISNALLKDVIRIVRWCICITTGIILILIMLTIIF